MRFVFVAPPAIDDEKAHRAMQLRVSIARDSITGTNPIAPTSGYTEYRTFIEGQGLADFNGLGYVVPNLEAKEYDLLNGEYDGQRRFHDEVLPELQHNIRRAIGEEALVHVDLGTSISTLYAAYFASLEVKCGMVVSFHTPPPDTPMRMGGYSVYAQRHPLLRRWLLSRVLTKAQVVFVDAEPLAGAVASLFPKIKPAFGLDPLALDDSEPIQQTLSSVREG